MVRLLWGESQRMLRSRGGYGRGAHWNWRDFFLKGGSSQQKVRCRSQENLRCEQLESKAGQNESSGYGL